MTNTVAIIQARMGSSRLPGKVMKPVASVPLIDRVIRNALAVPKINQVAVATSEKPDDNVLAAHIRKLDADLYRGSESDVLGRFAGAARQTDADIVVRITADDPVKDPEVARIVLDTYFNAGGRYDYVSNTNPPTWPEGQDVEVFSAAALFRAAAEATDPYDREHVTPYFHRDTSVFNCHNVAQQPDQSGIRLTLDTPDDLKFFERLLHFTDRVPPSLPDILVVLNANPEVSELNATAQRSAAYR